MIFKGLARTGTNLYAATYDGLFLSTDKGGHWTEVRNGLPEDLMIETLAVTGSNLCAGTDEGIFLSTDCGANWIKIDSSLPENTELVCFAASEKNLFVTVQRPAHVDSENDQVWSRTPRQDTGLGIFLSTDNGKSWQPVNSGLPENPYVCALAASGPNLYAGLLRPAIWVGDVETGEACGNGVFFSGDNGRSWTAIGSGLPAQVTVNSLFVHGPHIIAGTAGREVFLFDADRMQWTSLNLGLPRWARVSRFVVAEENLYAIINGAEVWRLPLAELKRT
jgi:hypothetical protein